MSDDSGQARVKPAPFTWHRAATLEEAIEILAADEDAKVLAGGQSLMPLLSLRLARPSTLVDLEGVSLVGIEVQSPAGRDELVVGAMTRQRSVELDPLVALTAPLLAEAARHVGYAATRNRGTIGGSLAHADPVAELPAVAVALGATIVARGPGGTRTIPAAELADGFFTTTLDPSEVLTEIRWPVAGPGHGASWQEWSPRHHDFPDAGVGVAVELDDDATITSVAAAACGIGGGPLPLGEVLVQAGVVGARAVGPSLLRAVGAAVTASASGADGERDELCGMLAARALAEAFRRAQEHREAA